jgi:hypothetical protein
MKPFILVVLAKLKFVGGVDGFAHRSDLNPRRNAEFFLMRQSSQSLVSKHVALTNSRQ